MLPAAVAEACGHAEGEGRGTTSTGVPKEPALSERRGKLYGHTWGVHQLKMRRVTSFML